MIKTQIVIKTLLAGVIALFITSCTKDDFTPAENNGVWQKVNIITSVEEGKEASNQQEKLVSWIRELDFPQLIIRTKQVCIYTNVHGKRVQKEL